MPSRQTAVEKWDRVHPGLRAEVDGMLAQRCPSGEIHEAIRERYGVSISERTIRKYKRGRWLPSALRVERYAEIVKGILKALGKENTEKLIFEQFLNRAIEASRDRPRLVPRTAPNPHKEESPYEG